MFTGWVAGYALHPLQDQTVVLSSTVTSTIKKNYFVIVAI